MALKLMNDPETREWIARRHITYEVHSLWSSAVEWAASPEASVREIRVKNALLEACLVHARLLAEFLDRKPNPKSPHDDAVAGHYLHSWNSKDTLNETERNTINWMIMHMNAERHRLNSGLDLIDTAERVLDVMCRFVAEIKDAEVRDWFHQVVPERAQFARELDALAREGTIVRTVATTNTTTIQTVPQRPGSSLS